MSRRSAADKAAPRFIAGIEPTRVLAGYEAEVWSRVTSAWPRDHWIKSDAEILTQYCAVCASFEAARVAGELALMEKAGRLGLTYATKLRITPQSRYDTRVASTEAKTGRQHDAALDRLIGGADVWANRQDELN